MPKKKIPKLNRKAGLYLQHTARKGRGVFCQTDIRAGEIIETTPAIILNERQTTAVENTILVDYTFTTGMISKKYRKVAKIRNPANASSAVMGILTFCNHSGSPNAEILWDEHDGTVYYMLRATKRIPKKTEICTTYGDTWFDERK